jgi:hypothetical protein
MPTLGSRSRTGTADGAKRPRGGRRWHGSGSAGPRPLVEEPAESAERHRDFASTHTHKQLITGLVLLPFFFKSYIVTS